MKFWAIGNLFQEETWFDFKEKEDSFDFQPTCMLPTKEMAEEYIEDHLSINYTPVEITIEEAGKGFWAWSRGPVSKWD